MTGDARSVARERAIAVRGELADTLNALEDKLNVPKQFHLAKRRAQVRLQRLWREKPAAAIALGTVAVAVVGAGVSFIVKRVVGN